MKNTNNSISNENTEDTSKEITEVACPQCRKVVPWTDDSVYRPFCSLRCQMIDFGDWAMEKNTIAAEEPPDDWENFEE